MIHNMWDGKASLNIISYDNLDTNTESFVFRFRAGEIIKYVLSPNKNQIAILFNMQQICHYGFDDVNDHDVNLRYDHRFKKRVKMVRIFKDNLIHLSI